MPERIIEERWVQAPARAIDNRMDTLRQRADYLARKIETSPTGTRRNDEKEYAALMWALAELSGIGDEVRRERVERDQGIMRKVRAALARAEQAETLNAQYRIKIQALKAEVYRLSRTTAGTGHDADLGTNQAAVQP